MQALYIRSLLELLTLQWALYLASVCKPFELAPLLLAMSARLAHNAQLKAHGLITRGSKCLLLA